VYSHYEFGGAIELPIDNALWTQMLSDDQAPPRLGWTAEFIVRQDNNVQAETEPE
jgi:hypothetical protein